ncbi:hypothetical protein HYC85_002003 [Camellia sinensis]|uniref:Uncharacterized protein n=1 Tax=Camellia sinensis TaxID=4442 RepID=A0A7J7I8S8_CAMSI|nr:hypothetical protein HYC85_002003 [Camellia sinensis]
MAAYTFDNREFWLLSEFLTDDDILMGKESFNENGLNSVFGPNFAFPMILAPTLLLSVSWVQLRPRTTRKTYLPG